MARRRRSSAFSGKQAEQALAFLIQEGKVAASEVQKALQRRERLIRELKTRLAEIGSESAAASGRFAKSAVRQWRSAEKASRPARKRAVSAATKAARQAQGRYMAAVRLLSKEARKQIREIRASKGVRAAIAAAKKLAK